MLKNGMSMVEVMIGIILLTLILVPSLSVIMSQTKSVTATRDHSQAAFLAQRTEEIARSYAFEFLDSDKYNSNKILQKKTFEWKMNNLVSMNQYTSNGITYNIKNVLVDPVVNSRSPSDPPIMYLLHFTIEYVGQDKRDHRLDIDTALAKRE